MPYTMKMLVEETGLTEQTIRKYFRKYSDEFAPSMDAGGRGKLRTYNDRVFELLKSKTNLNESVRNAGEQDKSLEIQTLQQRIEDLSAHIKTLEQQLAEKDVQLRESYQNTGAALLALQQEQERQKLLTAPKKSFWEKIFGGRSDPSS